MKLDANSMHPPSSCGIVHEHVVYRPRLSLICSSCAFDKM